MTFESSKNLSAIGTLLLVIGAIGSAVPFAGILSLVGIILLLIGLKGLANFYNEQDIFNNALYSIVTAIVGVVVAFGVVVISAVGALADLGIDLANIENWGTLGTDLGTIFTDFSDFGAIWSLISAVLIGVIILYVVFIVSMYFFRKTMNQLSTKSGIGLFGTAGLLMLIGAVIPIIGLLIMWIGLILATIAFFQLEKEQTKAT